MPGNLHMSHLQSGITSSKYPTCKVAFLLPQQAKQKVFKHGKPLMFIEPKKFPTTDLYHAS